jgi:predicted porin
MIKKLVAVTLAVFGLVNAAQAQQSDVQIYGLIDVGLVSVNGVGAQNGSALQFLNGGRDTSRIGFMGTEYLGNNNRVGFQLESQIMPNNGSQGLASGSGAANALFSRQAALFAEGKWGKMTMGRSNNASYQAFQVGDSRAGLNTGSTVNIYTDGSTFGGTSTAKTGIANLTGGTFISGQFRYDTPTWKGASASLTYAPGGQPDGITSGSIQSHALRWSGYGATLAYGFFYGENTAGQPVARVDNFAANYDVIKTVRVFAGQSNMANPTTMGQANSKFQLNSYGARYNGFKNITLTGGYYTMQDRITAANKNNTIAAGLDYNFSKRTRAYTILSRSQNEGNMGFAAYGGGNANLNSLAGTGNYPTLIMNPGITQTALAVGLQHRF